MNKQGFSVNDFGDLAKRRRETNGWGFTKDDLEKYHVRMVTDVRLVWSEDTPVEMREKLAGASHVLHYIAEKAIMRQLEHDNLTPTEQLDLFYGQGGEGEPPVLLRQSDWHEPGTEPEWGKP